MGSKTTVTSERISALLKAIYGERVSKHIGTRLQSLIDKYHSPSHSAKPISISEHDAVLITYGDQVKQDGVRPLRTLVEFCQRWLSGLVLGIHLLPFYPSSSDDGFSVIDYRSVDPALGGWEDITLLGQNFRLMFDAVINHVSAQSAWFQGFLEGDPHYKDYFIEVIGNPDLSKVVRPRALPLLTAFETRSNTKQIWTTFSTDQVDLNYRNPEVLLEVIDTLLFYVDRGAEFIRLDAIAYLWKEIGTTCIHLPQTHRIIQLLRAVLDLVAPHVILITETNVPHEENISYFGRGDDEAQLVYNFALPPLVLYTIYTGDNSILSEWTKGLSLPSKQVTFFNFLASHDGIGVNPVRGILPQEGVDLLIEKTLECGGLVSYKNNPDGSKSPYELNINYFDALCNPREVTPSVELADRFMAAQAIMLALVGVPGIYFHSLFGSRGWPEGVQSTGRNRTINRQKLVLDQLEQELHDPNSLRSLIYHKYSDLLKARASCPAFHPFGDQRVIKCGESIYALTRNSPDHSKKVLCLQNVSNQPRRASIEQFDDSNTKVLGFRDLISGKLYSSTQQNMIIMEPYQTLWLEESTD